MNPFFSIITVTLNNYFGLKKTVESILKQSCQDLELIIVDGLSSDETQNYVKNLSLSNCIFLSEKDTGIYNAQNKGIALANGSFLLFLNAGDCLSSNSVLESVKKDSNIDSDLLYGNINIIENEDSKLLLEYPKVINHYYWIAGNYLCHQAVFFNKKVFGNFGFYNEVFRFAADFDLIQRIWFHPDSKILKLNQTIVDYDLKGTSSLQSNRKAILKEYKQIIGANFPKFKIFKYFCKVQLIRFLQWKEGKTRRFIEFIKFVSKIVSALKPNDLAEYKLIANKFRKTRTSAPFVLHFCYSDSSGGAARAALNIHKGLLKTEMQSLLLVSEKKSSVENVYLTIPIRGLKAIISSLKKVYYNKYFINDIIDSGSLQSTQIGSKSDIKCILKVFKPDIVHLHWIGFDMLSIEDISQINVPIVWTLHDMWPFTATEHVTLNDEFIYGYNDLPSNSLRKSVYLRKKRNYSGKRMSIVGVSNWISNRAKESILLKEKNHNVIPNIIDTNVFTPHDRNEVRLEFGIEKDANVLLFGSDYKDSNKGYDFLEKVFKVLDRKFIKGECILLIFGKQPWHESYENLNLIQVGQVNNNETLSKLYSSANLTLVPSLLESFCLIAAESIASGTPVLSFDTSGLKDIIIQNLNGFKLNSDSELEFAEKILDLLNEERKGKYGKTSLFNSIESRFSESVVTNDYKNLYLQILEKV